MSLKKKNDYDVSFRKAIKHLYGLPRDVRMEEIDLMCRQYEEYHGEKPADYFLESMADSILNEELSDSNPDKVTINEYPILSESQLNRRRTGANGRKNTAREVTLNASEVDEYRSKYKDYPYTNMSPVDQIKAEASYYTEVNKCQPVTYSFDIPKLSSVTYKVVSGRGDGATTWARAVKDRDSYQCQNPLCTSRAGIMHAHHIHNYADYPELREEISNGTTLCEPCHRDFHSRYGNEYTNERDLKEFFGINRLNPENVGPYY